MCLWQQTSENPIKSRLSLSLSHTHMDTQYTWRHAQTHTNTRSPTAQLPRDPTAGLGKRRPPLGALPCPPTFSLGGDGRKLDPSPSLLSSGHLPLHPAPPVACVPACEHPSLLRTGGGSSQTQANALGGMFPLKINQGKYIIGV